jgi:hypothetical protein
MKQETQILRSVVPDTTNTVITKAIQLAKESRTPATSYSLSTRDLVQFLRNVERYRRRGLPIDNALQKIAAKFDGSDRRLIIDRINGIFATNLKDNTDES